MRRTLKLSLAVLPLLILLLFAGLLYLLVATEGGTRLLAGQALRWSGDLLHWQQFEGPLAGPMRIGGLEVRAPGFSLDAEELEFDWSPGKLLSGTLAVLYLDASGVRVELESGEPPPEESSPLRLSELAPPVDIRLDRFSVRDLEVHSGESRQAIDSAELSASLEDGVLSLPRLRVRAPEGGIEAQGGGALRDELPLQLEARWDWRLTDGRQLGGTLAARGDARELAIRHRGAGDLPMNLEGVLLDLLGEPGWVLDADWPRLVLPGGEQPVALEPGQLHSAGTLAGYRVEGAAAVSGLTQQALAWSLRANGDGGGLELATLDLGGPHWGVALSGRVDWTGPMAARLEYRAWGEELSALNPQLPPRLDASGQLAAEYVGDTARLLGFDLVLEQSPLTMNLVGEVSLPTAGEPHLEGELAWSSLHWPLAAVAPDVASEAGKLRFSGSAENYRLQLDADLGGAQIPPGRWHAEAEGDSAQLSLTQVLGETLGGELKLAGDIGWQPAPRWDLRVDGAGLDPGQWLPDLPGAIALALHTQGVVDADRGLQGLVELERVSGVLAARDFQLTARASLAGERIDLAQLRLDSGGNALSAGGSLAPDALSLDWELHAPAPGALLPGMLGEIAGSGRVTGSAAAPRVSASLRGQGLALEANSVGSLRLDLQAGVAVDDRLQVDLDLTDLAGEGGTLLQRGAIVVRGTTAQHTLDLELEAPEDVLRASLTGGLDPAAGIWRGALASLAADTADYGVWQLAAPAPLRLSATDALLGETCLRTADSPARACVQADWTGGRDANLAARLEALALDRFLPDFSGQLDGELQGALAADGSLVGRAGFEISAGELRVMAAQGEQRLTFDGARLDALVDGGGLSATLVVEGRQRRLLEAGAQMPQLQRLPLSRPQPLGGHVVARFDDLGGLQALVPDLGPTSGSLNADLQLAGTLEHPLLLGELSLRNASADIPAAGLELRDMELQLSGESGRPGVLVLDGGVTSGQGRLDLDGSFDIDRRTLELRMLGDRVLAYNTPDARAQLSPDLRASWDGETLKLRGRVGVPQADITPRLSLNPATLAGQQGAAPEPGATIAPSPDVVVLGVEGETLERQSGPSLPFRLDSRIEVALGKRVKVNTAVFIARVAGDVTFTNLPQQAELIPNAKGRLSIEDGTFRAFGQDLQIETGDIDFDGGPVTEPEITVRALRWIDNDPTVSAAGVLITGKATQPVLVMFSRPQLDPADIQSYLLTGRGIRNRESVLNIGTYIHPKIYVGYGYNLLTETSQFNTLYTITPRYGIEATAGEADNAVNLTVTYEH